MQLLELRKMDTEDSLNSINTPPETYRFAGQLFDESNEAFSNIQCSRELDHLKNRNRLQVKSR